jgi:predicted DNA-binding transcriptional regulator AlpA
MALQPRTRSNTRRKARTPTPYDPQADVVRPRHLPQAVGVHPATVWRWLRAGKFPAPIRLGEQAIGWRRADISAWLESRRAAS